MKARTVRVDGEASPSATAARLVTVRFAEMLSAAPALEGREDAAIHHFRLSCKRLRFAIERFAGWVPRAADVARTLREISDVTGEAHDAALLIKHAKKCGAHELARAEERRRQTCLDRARSAWRAAFESEPLRELGRYTGLEARTP